MHNVKRGKGTWQCFSQGIGELALSPPVLVGTTTSRYSSPLRSAQDSSALYGFLPLWHGEPPATTYSMSHQAVYADGQSNKHKLTTLSLTVS